MIKKFILTLLLLVGSAAGAHAQIVGGACLNGDAAVNPATGLTFLCVNSVWVLQPSQGGSGGPFSLTTLQSKFIGPAPDDCGNVTCTAQVSPPIRYVHFCYDGAIAGQPTTTFTSGTCAGFVAADVGSIIEIVNGLSGPALFSGTISAVNSATSITVSGNLTLNGTSLKFWYGSDATTPLQNWATAINNGIPTATGLLSHQGYLPRFYGTKQAVRLINALGTPGGLNTNLTGFGAPEPFSAFQTDESMAVWGAGGYSSGIVAYSTFNWALPSTSVDNGVLFYDAWNGVTLQNFAVISPDYGIAFNTSGNTGTDCGLTAGSSTHDYLLGMTVQNFHNTTTTMFGHCLLNSVFQSQENNNEFFRNDYNADYCSKATSFCNGLTLNGNYYQGATGVSNSGTGGNVVFDSNGAVYQNVQMLNSYIDDAGGTFPLSAGAAQVNIRSGVTTNGSDELRIENTKIATTTATPAIKVSTSAGVKLVLTNVYASGAAGQTALSSFMTGGSINIYGGNYAGGGGITNTNSASPIYAYGAALGAGTLTGPSIFGFFTTATGWLGPGVLQNTLDISNQGTACTNGELALSAGWQSTGSATVTAATGIGQTCSWTITTGTTTAANPTVTDTLTNPLPTATTVCWMSVNGGTHTPVVGAGTSDAFRQTTLSSTAPIFTYQETPTAGGTTYFVTRVCGP